MGIARVVLPAHVRVFRKEAAALLEKAFVRSVTDGVESWLDRCQNDTAQLWCAGPLWAITEVIEGKTGRALHIVAMAGEFDSSLMTAMETWGRSVGCKNSFFTGRVGWKRRLPDYTVKAVTFMKEL